MRFDLVDLRLFLSVAELGSITAGAANHHLATAAASTRMRNMETALGTELLERRARGVELTPAGRALQRHARCVLREIEMLKDEMSEYARGLKGHIRLMSNTNALTEFLPESLSSYLSTHPAVNIDLEERLSDEIVAAVAEGAADIGIVAATVAMAELETFPFRTDRFVIVAGSAHPLSARRDTAFGDTLDFDFVGLDRNSAIQRFLSEKSERVGRQLKLRVQLRSFDAICRLVECNVGIGVVPATTARRHARIMDLKIIELTDDWALRQLTICVRGLSGLPSYARDLVHHLTGSSAEKGP